MADVLPALTFVLGVLFGGALVGLIESARAARIHRDHMAYLKRMQAQIAELRRLVS